MASLHRLAAEPRRWDDLARRWWRVRAAAAGPWPAPDREFRYLAQQRRALLRPLQLTPGQTAGEVGAAYGLLAFGMADLVGETGKAICLVLDAGAWKLNQTARAGGAVALPVTSAVRFLRADPNYLPLASRGAHAVALRGELSGRTSAAAQRLLGECVRLLVPGGQFVCLEPLPSAAHWRAAPGTPPMPEDVRHFHHQILASHRQGGAVTPPAAPPRAGTDGAHEVWRPTTAGLLSALAQAGLAGFRARRGEQVVAVAATASEVLRWAHGPGCPFKPPLGVLLASQFPAEAVSPYLGYWVRAAEFGP